MKRQERKSMEERVSSYVTRRKTLLIALLIVLVVAIGGLIVFILVNSNAVNKGLSAIDSISEALTSGSENETNLQLEARREKAFSSLNQYLTKSGIVGVRANMLAGEITYSKKDYATSAKYWQTAAKKGKKSYTTSLSYFNAGVSYENAGDAASAMECYKKVISDKDFLLSAHAYFSLARLNENAKNKAEAVRIYKELNDKAPDTSWGQLAKSRIIALEDN